MRRINSIIEPFEKVGNDIQNITRSSDLENYRMWNGFWQLADPKIWVASVVPMMLGTAMAYRKTQSIHWGWFVLTITGIFMLEIGKNGINEAVDYISGADRFVTPENRNSFSGGKKTIVDGILSLKEVWIISWTTIVLGSAAGIIITVWRSPIIVWIGIAGLFAAIFYSQPPLKLAYRGLGGIVVGLTFGPMLTTGAYAVQTLTIGTDAMTLGVPIGLLIMNVLLINQFPDAEADRAAGKMTAVVRLGRKRSAVVYALIYVTTYASIGAIAFAQKNGNYLLALASLPFAIDAVRIAYQYTEDLPRFLRANARSIQIYIITGVALIVATLLSSNLH